MNRSKLLTSLLLAASLFFLPFFSVQATTNPPTDPLVKIEILGRPDCQHCQDLHAFLTDLSTQRQEFTFHEYNIYEPQDKQLFDALTTKESLPKATPIILIGTHVLQGFNTPETTGQDIIMLLDQYQGQAYLPREERDPRFLNGAYTVSEFLDQNLPSQSVGQPADAGGRQGEGVCDEECVADNSYYLNVPLLGRINAADYSLPVLSFILGFIDGFNPCAMWVLVSFLIILSQIGDRRKMFVFAGLFILAETIMYYLILTVWYTAWDFIGLDRIVTPIVGLVAIGGGLFFLWEWRKNDGACHITDLQSQQKTSNKIKDIASKPLTLITALAIIGIAFSVNIIEFACSIGIPQAFTKILEVNYLSTLTTHLYLSIYIFAYMIDDLIVFAIALYSFEKIGITTKYTRASQLIGGILMLILGLILIINPSLLIFT